LQLHHKRWAVNKTHAIFAEDKKLEWFVANVSSKHAMWR